MKKLLFVISQLYKGGAENSLVNLLNRLDYTKYDVELLILNQEPVENAVSLVGRINKNVKVCDAYAKFQKISFFDRVRAKLIYTMEQKGAYYFTALDFVRNKVYDWAFFIGEWYTPSFVAYEVQAKIKAAWIHNDLSEAEYFNAEQYFYFLDQFDYYIFVSKNSMEVSIQKYPFLKDKAVCIYNINDVDYIKEKAKEPVADWPETALPVLLTCANFRSQKNHMRQVSVMAELKRRGLDFLWLNIGATTDEGLIGRIKAMSQKEGLKDKFLVLGSRENPYQYIKKADAVAVLSDYESWSMVITEAKIIGTPVIATKTSGAMEQLEDEKTGILADFSVSDIADQIEKFLKRKALQKSIRKNISNFDNTQKIIKDFSELLLHGEGYEERKKKASTYEDILYIIDDINYVGGAHTATKFQIRELVKQGKCITVFTGSIPEIKIRKELCGVGFLSWKNFPQDVLFHKRLFYCLVDKTLSKEEHRKKLKQVWDIKVLKKENYYETRVLPLVKDVFSKYSVACVMSEGSSFRAAVANAACKKKIQWIHTDYCKWREFNEWTLRITKDDGEIYSKFNSVVVLSEKIKSDFLELYPFLDNKVEVIRNILPVEEIIKKSKELVKVYPKVHFITVGRLDQEKAFERLIEILSNVRNYGYDFLWEIVGDGPDKDKIQGMIDSLDLGDKVKLLGWRNNPYPFVKKAQIFSLLSVYEGMPNTIYEALILGVPVLATDVGGIREQVKNGVDGWIVANDKQAIEEKICYLIEHQEEIEEAKKSAQRYQYKNDIIIEQLNRIF